MLSLGTFLLYEKSILGRFGQVWAARPYLLKKSLGLIMSAVFSWAKNEFKKLHRIKVIFFFFNLGRILGSQLVVQEVNSKF